MSNGLLKLREREWGRRHWLPLVYRKTIRLREIGPLVTFTFDDFPRTAYSIGGAILKSFGACGTYYTSLGLMNTTDSTGDQFHLDDLHGLVGDGHELASHTCHHVSSRSLSSAAFVQEVLEGKEGIRRVAGLKVSNNFAYPFGRVTAAVKCAVGKAMRSCRGSYPGVNGSLVDLSLLRANPLYGDTEKLGLIRRLLQVSQECGGWIIFYTHDVRNIHSPWGCTPALLEAVVKLALSSSMRILTVKEVLGDQ